MVCDVHQPGLCICARFQAPGPFICLWAPLVSGLLGCPTPRATALAPRYHRFHPVGDRATLTLPFSQLRWAPLFAPPLLQGVLLHIFTLTLLPLCFRFGSYGRAAPHCSPRLMLQGVLLQIFTKPVGDRPTVFFEIIERLCTLPPPAEVGAGGWCAAHPLWGVARCCRLPA